MRAFIEPLPAVRGQAAGRLRSPIADNHSVCAEPALPSPSEVSTRQWAFLCGRPTEFFLPQFSKLMSELSAPLAAAPLDSVQRKPLKLVTAAAPMSYTFCRIAQDPVRMLGTGGMDISAQCRCGIAAHFRTLRLQRCARHRRDGLARTLSVSLTTNCVSAAAPTLPDATSLVAAL